MSLQHIIDSVRTQPVIAVGALAVVLALLCIVLIARVERLKDRLHIAKAAAEDAAKGFKPRPTLGGFPEPELAAPFFYQLKELTVLGYYTSEVGATQELAYLPIPGHYEGDYDFTGKQWSS